MDTTSLILLCTILPLGIILLLILLRIFYMNSPKNKENSDIRGKIIIVTGCSSGVGKLTAFELLKQGAIVIMACRNKQKTDQIISQIPVNRDNATFIQLDLSSYGSIIRFVDEFRTRFGKCDMLINNAGAINESYSTINELESTYMSNVIGPIVLTSLMIDLIVEKGRIINISSYAVNFVKDKALERFLTDGIYKTTYASFENYALSKLGNLYHTQHLEKYLAKKGRDIKTCAIHPGTVNSDLPQNYKTTCAKVVFCIIYPIFWYCAKTLWMGAQTTLHAVHVGYDNLKNGGFYMDCRETKLSGIRTDFTKMMEYMDYTKRKVFQTIQTVPVEVKDYFE
jgi:NAD(P)-dependent dehydrogenase (short-subunit alcohol dehydrogenase family)